MKRLFNAVLCILLMLSLVACADKSAPVDEESPSANKKTPFVPAIPNPPPVTEHNTPDVNKPLFKIGDVHTDYSAYTTYTHTNDEIYTRLSTDFLPELIPSNGYGTLVPYVGEYFCELDWDSFVMYGLCTTGGMIVTDPVYKDVYQPSEYSNYQGTIKYPVYKLERLMAENENRYSDIFDDGGSDLDNERASAESEGAANEPSKKIPNIAVCALDGSWVTDYYNRADFYEEIMLLHRDKDADVFDYNGNFLYNTQVLKVDIKLNDDPLVEWANYIVDYQDGLFFLRVWKWVVEWEGEREDNWRCILSAFVNELTGEVYILDYEDVSAFQDGRAAVRQGGLWGYINTDMELVIGFQFDSAESFIGGLAKCRLPDGRHVLITKDGEITAESYSYFRNPAEKSYSDYLAEPEFIYDDSGGTDVRDRNGKILFTYDGRLRYLEQARMFSLSHYNLYGYWNNVLTTFELIDANGKCVFRKNVASQWRDD